MYELKFTAAATKIVQELSYCQDGYAAVVWFHLQKRLNNIFYDIQDTIN